MALGGGLPLWSSSLPYCLRHAIALGWLPGLHGVYEGRARSVRAWPRDVAWRSWRGRSTERLAFPHGQPVVLAHSRRGTVRSHAMRILGERSLRRRDWFASTGEAAAVQGVRGRAAPSVPTPSPLSRRHTSSPTRRPRRTGTDCLSRPARTLPPSQTPMRGRRADGAKHTTKDDQPPLRPVVLLCWHSSSSTPSETIPARLRTQPTNRDAIDPKPPATKRRA